MNNRGLKGVLQHFVRETFPREVLALVWRNRMVAHAGDMLPQETLSGRQLEKLHTQPHI